MIRYYVLGAAIAALDQLTKALAEGLLKPGVYVDLLPFLSWKLSYNKGAAFSFLAGAGGWQRWFFVAVGVGFSIFLIWEIRKLKPGQWLYGTVYGFILGGAIGNLIDRVLHGEVVDFVAVHYGWFNFPVFNVADSAVFLGAVGWIYLLINEMRGRHESDIREVR